ncbi:MAG TPA: aminotransferase class V-fold PLP-dependent enzyme [Streptosporangiaceae bacterium]|nr:aminotransferase class V-fold PLP-dependent enzyme [Streptosporangiaceae bacterium]
MVFDVERARRDTPGTARVAHLNNAGSALPPTQVTEAVIAHLRLEAEIGGYEAADAVRDRIDAVYPSIARLIGCQPHEVAVVENATRAWDMAFYAMSFDPGDRILTARAEYASNVIAYLQVAQRTGATVEVVDDDEYGQLSVTDLRSRLEHGTGEVKLIAMTHVPTQGGLVNPAEEVGAAARRAGVPFLLDACQSVGQFPVDVERIGCDMLSATGRKFLRGPRGTGFLYVRESMLDRLEPPFLDLHAATWTGPGSYTMRADARRFENWETNYAGKIGLGVATEYAMSWGLDAIEARVTELAENLRGQLRDLDGVTVHDQGRRRCGIVTFTVDGVPASEIQQLLAARNINTSVCAASSARFDLPGRGLTELIRASVHYYNTEAEIARLIGALPAPRMSQGASPSTR